MVVRAGSGEPPSATLVRAVMAVVGAGPKLRYAVAASLAACHPIVKRRRRTRPVPTASAACDHRGMDGNDEVRRAVCVHGAGGGGWEWAVWGRVLAACGWDVLAPDLQPIDAGIAATRLDDYRAQALGWCTTPVDLLIGASLGGLIALSIAAQVQPSVMVLVNPLPPRGFLSKRLVRETYSSVVPWGRSRSLSSTRRALPDADDASCIAAFRRWRDESGAVMNAALAGIDVVAPRCPLLILASGNDDDVPPESTSTLAQSLGADYELLPKTSHVGPLLGRNATRIAQRVADWAERCFSQHNVR